MAGNRALQVVDDSGWHSGLRNLMRQELGRWWGTRRWWLYSLLWVGIIGGLILMIGLTARVVR